MLPSLHCPPPTSLCQLTLPPQPTCFLPPSASPTATFPCRRLYRPQQPTLHCTALHCNFPALHGTALNCTVLHCTSLHSSALHYTAQHPKLAAPHFISVTCSIHKTGSLLTCRIPAGGERLLPDPEVREGGRGVTTVTCYLL